MSGNIWEWCWDWSSDDYYKACKTMGIVENPTGPKEGTSCVTKGNAWIQTNQSHACHVKNNDLPSGIGHYLGFRLVLSPILEDSEGKPFDRKKRDVFFDHKKK